MAKDGTTRFALLGFLTWGPMSGYDIRKTVAQSLGNFWNESYGQIYPTLKTLEAEGLVTRTAQRASGRPDRHVHAITPAGRDALQSWLRRPAEPLKHRVEVLVKLLFGGVADRATLRSHVARFRDEQRALLASYARSEARLREESADAPDLPLWLLTVQCGQEVGRAYLAWCDRADAVIAALPEPDPALEAGESRGRNS